MGIPATGDRRTTHFFMVKSRFVVTPIPAPGPRTFSRARWPGRARVAYAQGPPRRSPATTPSAAGSRPSPIPESVRPSSSESLRGPDHRFPHAQLSTRPSLGDGQVL